MFFWEAANAAPLLLRVINHRMLGLSDVSITAQQHNKNHLKAVIDLKGVLSFGPRGRSLHICCLLMANREHLFK